MKKIISLLTALLLTSAVFAKGNHEADLQLQIGIGFSNVICNDTNDFNVKSKGEATAVMFTGAIDTWQMFGSSDFFKFGVMVNGDFAIGKTTSMKETVSNHTAECPKSELDFAYLIDFFIGPAFTFNFGNTVKLGVAPGLSFVSGQGFSCKGDWVNISTGNVTRETLITEYTALGFGFVVRAKFLPNKKVSPIVGYKFTVNFTDKCKDGKYENGGITSYGDGITKLDSCVLFTNTLTAGIAINF